MGTLLTSKSETVAKDPIKPTTDKVESAEAQAKYKKVMVKSSRDKAPDDEIRVSVQGQVNGFVGEAIKKFVGKGCDAQESVKILARGPAISKAVIIAEILCRRISSLEQSVELGSEDVKDTYEKVEGEAAKAADELSITRIVPYLVVTLKPKAGEKVTSESIEKADRAPRFRKKLVTGKKPAAKKEADKPETKKKPTKADRKRKENDDEDKEEATAFDSDKKDAKTKKPRNRRRTKKATGSEEETTKETTTEKSDSKTKK